MTTPNRPAFMAPEESEEEEEPLCNDRSSLSDALGFEIVCELKKHMNGHHRCPTPEGYLETHFFWDHARPVNPDKEMGYHIPYDEWEA